MFPKKLRRRLLWGSVILATLAIAGLARPVFHLLRTASRDVDEREPIPPGFTDDASRLNLTRVREVRKVPVQIERAEEQIRQLLAEARREGWKVAIAGARHSLGGHTIYPGGVVLDMLPLKELDLDLDAMVLHVQSGALWKDVIAYLDEQGCSVAVMQSNNSFSVGGSLSVNCHGWQYGRPPIASTVRSFRLMKADGTIVRCSRDDNPELFSLALGGYGLFGVILDVELTVVPNRRYELVRSVVAADESLAELDEQIARHPTAAMVYARVSVASDSFLDEVILYVLHEGDGAIPPLNDPGSMSLRRSVFRGSVQSEYGKRLRWDAETGLQPLMTAAVYSRNQLLNEGVEVFQNRSSKTTDILHEYFVPRERIAEFFRCLRRIIPEHGADLLNVTIRSVQQDTDTFLRYADRDLLSVVMLFTQPRTAEGDRQMRNMTREISERALALEGRYYLPYRLHATRDQFERAYPRAREFFERKRAHDPGEIFQNQFYVEYGR